MTNKPVTLTEEARDLVLATGLSSDLMDRVTRLASASSAPISVDDLWTAARFAATNAVLLPCYLPTQCLLPAYAVLAIAYAVSASCLRCECYRDLPTPWLLMTTPCTLLTALYEAARSRLASSC
eukprot:2052499-Rhodomonas_salina.1